MNFKLLKAIAVIFWVNIIYLLVFPLSAPCPIINPSVYSSEDTDEGTRYFDQDDPLDPGIYGRAWIGSLTYNPATDDEPVAYISSSHSADAFHYYDEEIDVTCVYRLQVDQNPVFFFTNNEDDPTRSDTLGAYDPVTQPMPEDSFEHSDSLEIDVTDLPERPDGLFYSMSGYTRIDAWHPDFGALGPPNHPEADVDALWKAELTGIPFDHNLP